MVIASHFPSFITPSPKLFYLPSFTSFGLVCLTFGLQTCMIADWFVWILKILCPVSMSIWDTGYIIILCEREHKREHYICEYNSIVLVV